MLYLLWCRSIQAPSPYRYSPLVYHTSQVPYQVASVLCHSPPVPYHVPSIPYHIPSVPYHAPSVEYVYVPELVCNDTVSLSYLWDTCPNVADWWTQSLLQLITATLPSLIVCKPSTACKFIELLLVFYTTTIICLPLKKFNLNSCFSIIFCIILYHIMSVYIT